MNIHNLEFCTCADGQNSECFLARAIVRLVESDLNCYGWVKRYTGCSFGSLRF